MTVAITAQEHTDLKLGDLSAQLDYLRWRGCDEVQGHVFARAASGPDVEELLRNGRRVHPNGART